jgi:hypothetical protein
MSKTIDVKFIKTARPYILFICSFLLTKPNIINTGRLRFKKLGLARIYLLIRYLLKDPRHARTIIIIESRSILNIVDCGTFVASDISPTYSGADKLFS